MSGVAAGHGDLAIDIGECRLDTDEDVALQDAAADLSEAEHRRASTFVFARDRDRFVRARSYLRRRVGAFIGLAANDVPLLVADGGKPYVFGDAVSFSLSHSGGFAVVAVGRSGEIGIDLECVERSDRLDDQLDALARFCLTGDEQRALARTSPQARRRRFLSYWTAKEARMKLTGEGMALDPRAIALDLCEGEPVGYMRPSSPAASLRFIRLSAPGAVCCLAVLQDSGRTAMPWNAA